MVELNCSWESTGPSRNGMFSDMVHKPNICFMETVACVIEFAQVDFKMVRRSIHDHCILPLIDLWGLFGAIRDDTLID